MHVDSSMRKPITAILLLASLTLSALASADPVNAAELPGLIPLPQQIDTRSGHFTLDSSVQIEASDEAAAHNARLLQTLLREQYQLELPLHIGAGKQPAGKRIRFLGTMANPDLNATGNRTAHEAYQLLIDDGAIVISGAATGQFYALQTLLQLLPAHPAPAKNQSLILPALAVRDQPRFDWRGMHLDVGRHLYPVDFIKKLLDQMARYKLNRFHWHLTEDQGWRIEIKQYPRLTEIGAWRKETVAGRKLNPYVGDGQRYGGFYTQEQVREIVAYAAARHIMVVPEIEMPGHSLAALAAYPHLACTDGPFEVGTTWGVYDDIYCPKEETFTFLENVLKEVMTLFPAPYIHIGGDEAPKTRWQQSAVAQEVIRREGLKDEHELQSWFIRRMEKFLHAHGKRLIGWDEILEGGLAPDATVMSWRGESGGIAAARHGNDVIMTPNYCCYFDYKQGPADSELWDAYGDLPAEKVYAYNPVPAELTAEQQQHIRGVQANIWTEYLKTPQQVEYMAFPRLLALAEVAWTAQQQRDYRQFERRLEHHYPRLQQADIFYRIPPPRGLQDVLLAEQADYRLQLHAPVPGSRIHYTLDGSTPTRASAQFREPLDLQLAADTPLTVRTLTVTADGRDSAIHRATLHNRRYLPAQSAPPALQAGARLSLIDGLFGHPLQLDTAPVAQHAIAQVFDPQQHAQLRRQDIDKEKAFGLIFDGWLQIPSDGIWRFATQGDDRSMLHVDDQLVVDNSTYDLRVEGAIPLRAGWHRLRLRYYQRYGGIGLKLWMARDGETLQVMEADQWQHSQQRSEK